MARPFPHIDAMMDTQTALAQLQLPTDLTILSLSTPYLTLGDSSSTTKRTSTSSSENRGNATPTILSADLAHYQDLFSKLRFSYVEQVTKERFLKSITAGQPGFVDAAENVALQEQLLVEKAGLKERKREVREIVEALEEQGRQLAGRESAFWLRLEVVLVWSLIMLTSVQDMRAFSCKLLSSGVCPQRSQTWRRPLSGCANLLRRTQIIQNSRSLCNRHESSCPSEKTNWRPSMRRSRRCKQPCRESRRKWNSYKMR